MPHVQRMIPLDQIKPHPRNSHTHSKKQIGQIANSIRAVGFASPVLIDENDVLLAGHGRLEAARLLGLKDIPAVVIDGLSEAKKRALLLADNRIAQNAGWDRELLAGELKSLPQLLLDDGLEISLTGFEPAEIDALFADFEQGDLNGSEDVDLSPRPVVSRANDAWMLGKHRLLCGDARDPAQLQKLMGSELAQAAFLDPPYNLAVKSIGGRGSVQHAEFAMASGEMSEDAFAHFLTTALKEAARVSKDGAVHYVCMDWRHLGELLTAGKSAYRTMLNLAVWVKTNAGQGSFYRSQHELIGVFRVGDTPHINTVELGRHGRSRSNVWRYAGANTFRVGRMEDLQDHPTVKPVDLIADVLKDCTRRGDIVLDSFCGSGTTLLAAERVGRCGRGVEIHPGFVDVAIRRWQSFTGKDAVHIDSGLTFEEVHRDRAKSSSPVPKK